MLHPSLLFLVAPICFCSPAKALFRKKSTRLLTVPPPTPVSSYQDPYPSCRLLFPRPDTFSFDAEIFLRSTNTSFASADIFSFPDRCSAEQILLRSLQKMSDPLLLPPNYLFHSCHIFFIKVKSIHQLIKSSLHMHVVERPLAASVFELQPQEKEEEHVLLNPSLTEDPPLSASRRGTGAVGAASQQRPGGRS